MRRQYSYQHRKAAKALAHLLLIPVSNTANEILESIADKLSTAGWSWGYCSAVTRHGWPWDRCGLTPVTRHHFCLRRVGAATQ